MAGRKKITWSPNAKLDLYRILDFFYQRNGNSIYSRRIYSRLHKTINLLATQSFLGKPTDYDKIRVLVYSEYLIFYEVLSDHIYILKVWDSRRNPDDLKMKI
jgi:plasmid stabilization system protein ParE